jgi:hypothetical protein
MRATETVDIVSVSSIPCIQTQNIHKNGNFFTQGSHHALCGALTIFHILSRMLSNIFVTQKNFSHFHK